jgi:hypothetical protein
MAGFVFPYLVDVFSAVCGVNYVLLMIGALITVALNLECMACFNYCCVKSGMHGVL